MTTLLSCHSLSRFYGRQQAVNNVSFDLHKGEVLGFLGPNGAGKSTTMKMLSGNLAPHNGSVTINGYDLLTSPKKAKAHIGYLPDQVPLYKELTVKEFLFFCATINQIARSNIKSAVNGAVERCGLGDVTTRLIANLSKGYQQRVGIAQAIIHTPAAVILDEPTSGLDPIQIKEIRQLIVDIASEHSVVLSTHILPEVQILCDRVQIIDCGQLVFSDTLTGLSECSQNASLLVSLKSPPALDVLQAISGVLSVEKLSASRLKIHFSSENNPTEELLKRAVDNSWQLTEMTTQKHSLEDIFTEIIEHQSRNIQPTKEKV